MNYYNENDPFAASWLRALIEDKQIPKGHVDERSIKDVKAKDLEGFAQHHFFAGIGGWSLALKLAGWPEDRPVWTGSCPCQGHSVAGKQQARKDPRHLWPAFFRLIREYRPPVVFGEQVANAIRHGWLDDLCDDMEGEDYAVGAHVLPACSIDKDHIRQRLWWVAYAEKQRCDRQQNSSSTSGGGRTKDCRRNGGLADPDGRLSSDGELQRGGQHGQRTEDCRLGVGQADAKGNGRREECSNTNRRASRDRTEGWTAGPLPSGDGCGIHYAAGARRDTTRTGAEEAARDEARLRGRECGRAAVFIPCADGKWRRVPATAQGRPEPALFPLVDAGSVRKRVGILRGSGNAIVSEFTAEFILAAEEARA